MKSMGSDELRTCVREIGELMGKRRADIKPAAANLAIAKLAALVEDDQTEVPDDILREMPQELRRLTLGALATVVSAVLQQ
jgi:hypothetical protein